MEVMVNLKDCQVHSIQGGNDSQRQVVVLGFNALNYKPYKGIGDPFYLDEKKLILHSLGQWDENQDWETSSSSEDDDENTSSAVAPKASMTAAKFVLRRTRKDLNTLNKEVVKGSYFGPSIQDGHSEVGATNEALSLADDGMRTPRSAHSKPSSAKSRLTSAGKKKGAAPRPFTPQHNCLTEVTEYNEEISREALFRQLCALNWILDAMNLEHGCTMAPISTSWSHFLPASVQVVPRPRSVVIVTTVAATVVTVLIVIVVVEVVLVVVAVAVAKAVVVVAVVVVVAEVVVVVAVVVVVVVVIVAIAVAVAKVAVAVAIVAVVVVVNNIAATQPYLTAPSNQRDAPDARVVTPDEEETLHKTAYVNVNVVDYRNYWYTLARLN
ncbi:coiled-coil domain-containing protein 60-like [Elysia marginata]|uniref:Coiled-coil domain-containing protein 60-like n=1 Tax=Elysia marginata TaxID=1093978 RepID=A0AAV4JKZ1_9GAST|nr:coiled-coil domain-containing protein 60-like [Elysia marginata]